MPTDYDNKLANLTFRLGHAAKEDIEACGREIVRLDNLGTPRDLADLMIERGLVSEKQVLEMDRRLELAGVNVPNEHAVIRERREREAAQMSRVELGEIPDEAFGGSPVCSACGAILAEEIIDVRSTDEGAPRLCARCRSERAVKGQIHQGYRIEEKVGEGRLGIVYRARDLKRVENVALKIYPERLFIDNKKLNAFLTAVSASFRITDPHLVAFLHAGRWGRNGFVVTEYVEGETLRSAIDRNTNASLAKRIDALGPMLGDCLEALAKLHDKGHAHEEFRPRKVILSQQDGARLTDWMLPTPRFFKVTPPAIDDYYEPSEDTGRASAQQKDLLALARIAVEVLLGNRPEQIPTEQEMHKTFPRAVVDFIKRVLNAHPSAWPSEAGRLRRELHRLSHLD